MNFLHSLLFFLLFVAYFLFSPLSVSCQTVIPFVGRREELDTPILNDKARAEQLFNNVNINEPTRLIVANVRQDIGRVLKIVDLLPELSVSCSAQAAIIRTRNLNRGSFGRDTLPGTGAGSVVAVLGSANQFDSSCRRDVLQWKGQTIILRSVKSALITQDGGKALRIPSQSAGIQDIYSSGTVQVAQGHSASQSRQERNRRSVDSLAVNFASRSTRSYKRPLSFSYKHEEYKLSCSNCFTEIDFTTELNFSWDVLRPSNSKLDLRLIYAVNKQFEWKVDRSEKLDYTKMMGSSSDPQEIQRWGRTITKIAKPFSRSFSMPLANNVPIGTIGVFPLFASFSLKGKAELKLQSSITGELIHTYKFSQTRGIQIGYDRSRGLYKQQIGVSPVEEKNWRMAVEVSPVKGSLGMELMLLANINHVTSFQVGLTGEVKADMKSPGSCASGQGQTTVDYSVKGKFQWDIIDLDFLDDESRQKANQYQLSAESEPIVQGKIYEKCWNIPPLVAAALNLRVEGNLNQRSINTNGVGKIAQQVSGRGKGKKSKRSEMEDSEFQLDSADAQQSHSHRVRDIEVDVNVDIQ